MFQSVRDAQTRRELGEHYTSEENILKTLNPLFLDELRAEFDACARRGTPTGRRSTRSTPSGTKLGDIRYMDPACGCGNFIIVAYRELRDLELQIMDALADAHGRRGAVALDADWTHLLKVTLDHFYGIEIDEWPARIAETAMFLIDRQCDLKMKERFGDAPERLPIQQSAQDRRRQRAPASTGQSVCRRRTNVVVAGNPPFLGISLRVGGADRRTAGGVGQAIPRHARLRHRLARMRAQVLRHDLGPWAFVTTNSITQGEAVAPLFRPILEQGWQIKFGHRTFKWTSEASGAGRCPLRHHRVRAHPEQPSGCSTTPTVDGPPVEVDGVKNISPYLTDGVTVIVDPATRPSALRWARSPTGTSPPTAGG